jgi:hypothetical protein
MKKHTLALSSDFIILGAANTKNKLNEKNIHYW